MRNVHNAKLNVTGAKFKLIACDQGGDYVTSYIAGAQISKSHTNIEITTAEINYIRCVPKADNKVGHRFDICLDDSVIVRSFP